jgi:very-short-patch-repair endonuclease
MNEMDILYLALIPNPSPTTQEKGTSFFFLALWERIEVRALFFMDTCSIYISQYFLYNATLILPRPFMGEGSRVREESMSKASITQARTLRKRQTPQEIKMWARLRNRQLCGLKFRRQYMIGPYIVDFVCVEKKFIIEIDGWQHKEEFSGEKEKQRSIFLQTQGYHIVRFWNNEIDGNIDGVFFKLEEIIHCLA